MGWIWLLVFAVATGLGLWRIGKLDRGGLELVGAALCLALAGYAWQGSPSAIPPDSSPRMREHQP